MQQSKYHLELHCAVHSYHAVPILTNRGPHCSGHRASHAEILTEPTWHPTGSQCVLIVNNSFGDAQATRFQPYL